MSSKYALIFALVALCCLANCEAGTRRSSAVVRSPLLADEVGEQEVDIEQEQKEDNELDGDERQQAGELEVQPNEQRNPIVPQKPKQTVQRPSHQDGRARRVVRRGSRRGLRRNRSNRRRRGGRRRGGRRNRAGRRNIRRRSGRPLRG